jgi:hypothetical protein
MHYQATTSSFGTNSRDILPAAESESDQEVTSLALGWYRSLYEREQNSRRHAERDGGQWIDV